MRLTRPLWTLLTKRLLLIDVETTGVNPISDCIVQIASCVLSRGALHEEECFSSLVRPVSPISPEAEKIHGLTEHTLRDAPPLAEALKSFDSYAPHDAFLCGHNVSFDVAFLKEAYRRVGIPYSFDYHTIDIWSIAFFVLGSEGIELEAYNLDALCTLFGLARKKHHDALEDVHLSAAILRHLFAEVRQADLAVEAQANLFRQAGNG